MGQDAGGINVLGGRAGWWGKHPGKLDWSGQLGTDESAWLAQASPTAVQATPLPLVPAIIPAAAAAATVPVPQPQASSAGDGGFGAAARQLEAAALPASTSPAYPAMYVFGGSLTDVGNLFAADGGTSPVSPYFDGRFSNGPLWIEDYAAHFGMPAPAPALLGGTDFSFAGALTGAADLPSTGHDLPQQLAAFDTLVPNPVPGALYVTGTGVNDLTEILATQASIPVLEQMVNASVRAEVAFISDLATRGATNFLIPNVLDIGKTPLENIGGPQQAANASNIAAYYNAQFAATLTPLAITDHLNIDIVDTYSLIDQIVANPAAYGFTNVTDPVWTGNATDPNSGTLAATTQAGQDKYLFFDSLHPTEAAAALLAAATENVVFR